MSTTGRRCPDFDLATPVAIDPAVLLPVEGEPRLLTQTKQFTLLLALVFNDFKTVAWVHDRIEEGRPSQDEPLSGYSGQWSGFMLWVERISAGMLHELYLLLDTYSQNRTIKCQYVERAVRRMPKEHRKVWRDHVADAISPSGEKIRKYMDDVRNKSAFHYRYRGTEMLNSYREHCQRDPTDPRRRFAYVSLGKNAEGTRFYFADAAVESDIRAFERTHRVPVAMRQDALRRLNFALRHVIAALLEELQDESTKRASAEALK